MITFAGLSVLSEPRETIWVRTIPDFENSRSLSSVLLPIKLLPLFSPFWKCLLLWLLLSFQSYGLQSPHSPTSFPITLQKTALWPLTPYTKHLRLNNSLTPWASPSLKPSHLLLFLTLYSLLACCCLVPRSCLTLLWPHGQYVAHQLPLSMGFPRQEYWSGLPRPSLRELHNPGIKPMSLASQVDSYCWATGGDLSLVIFCDLHWSLFLNLSHKYLWSPLSFTGRGNYKVLANNLCNDTKLLGCASQLGHFHSWTSF